MDKSYIQRLQDELPLLEEKLELLESDYKKTVKEFGTEHWKSLMAQEKVSISRQYLFNRKEFIKNGIPKNVEQSHEIPYETINEF